MTGKPLTNIVSVGIGGSYLGPEFVYESLRMEPAAKAASEGRCLRFLANVDPVDVARALEGLDPETTLVVIISKTFTTAETMLNARTLRDWLLRHLSPAHDAKDVVRQHVIACTTNVEGATAFGILESNLFGFWDWVGGRYSVCSAVGVVPLALHYGFPIVRRFLDGAHAIDKHFLEAPLEKVGWWEMSVFFVCSGVRAVCSGRAEGGRVVRASPARLHHDPRAPFPSLPSSLLLRCRTCRSCWGSWECGTRRSWASGAARCCRIRRR